MDLVGQVVPLWIVSGLLNEIAPKWSNDGNETEEQAREPRMNLLPLLKPSIIYPYYIYKLACTWNGPSRSVAAVADTCWVAELDSAKMEQ